MIPFSILDLSPIPVGESAATALQRTLDLAQHAERWGYQRFWLAEHHNMAGIACAATSVVIGYVAGGTKSIRVGAGGIMLPNHPPLVIAEQFGTLASLYPNRIDLGLGRAPGSDGATAKALRRDPFQSEDQYLRDIFELQGYFDPHPDQKIHAIPGKGLDVPLWLLGSSLFSAQVASQMGLPYAFASHFAPDSLMEAIFLYRKHFTASTQLTKPHVMVGLNVVAAETDEAARRHFTSVQQSFANLLRGKPGQLPPPIDDIESYWSPAEKAHASRMLACSVVGSKETVRKGIRQFIGEVGPDELILTCHIHDHQARLHSFEMASQIHRELAESSH
jgi:luciferase family oxidoreductase group 1